MHKLISRPRKSNWPEDGLTLDHIADKPMTFRTRKELSQYCKQHGLSSGALL